MIDKETVTNWMQIVARNPKHRIVHNALTKSPFDKAATNWETVRQINHSFSLSLQDDIKATSQQKSGRCWLFAGLNVLRTYMYRKYTLENFEFSQSYLFFFDKLERSHYFLENIIETANLPTDDRLVSHLLTHPVEDGGQWHMFTSLIEKYGLVPKDVYPDNESCLDSGRINYVITLRLRAAAKEIRSMIQDQASKEKVEEAKKAILEEIYRILYLHMGNPPQKFDWSFTDKHKKHHHHSNIDPLSFYRKFLKVDLGEFVCLVHSPRKITPYNEIYTVDYLGNIVEGHPIRYINVDMETMKKATITSLQHDDPVWMGCDVGKQLHRDLGVMDLDLYPYEDLYEASFALDKEHRMLYGESQMTHAMVFSGVHLEKNKPVRWRVENSWSEKVGNKGFFVMSDAWFDEYMFEIAVKKEHLPKSVVDLLQKPVKHLDPWDPLGALAT